MKYASLLRFSLMIIAALQLNTLVLCAQTNIIKGPCTNSGNIIYTWDGKHLYKGNHSNSSEIIYTFDGKHIYRGRYTNSNDILYTSDEKYL